MGEIGIKIIPSFHTNVEFWGDSIFLKTIFLTLSNPLTIIFWAGVFSAKISEGTMKKKDMYLFGIGAVMSTLLFLSMIAVLGNFANAFLPPTILIWLNIIVGGILIIFGIKTINPSFPFL